MEKNPAVSSDTYYSNLKQRSASIQLKTAEQTQTLRRICLGLCGPPRLSSKLQEDYVSAVRISKLSLVADDDESFAILKNIYNFLIPAQEEPSKQGRHWELIGFQGENPATDLRATGLLSLVHLLFFFEHNPAYFRSLHSLGKSEQGNYPFSVVGINITKLVLDCMREGVLNKEFIKRKDVTVVMHLFYQGLWYYLEDVIKNAKTPQKLMEFYQTFQAVETFARGSPSRVLENYEKFLVTYDQQQGSDLQTEAKIQQKPQQASMEVGLTDITLEVDGKSNNQIFHPKQE